MAILSLDLIHYSNQNRNTAVESPNSRSGYGVYKFANTLDAAKLVHEKPQKKILIRKRKIGRNDTLQAGSSVVYPQKKPTPKSDMQVMQFYAQPVPTIDVSYHAPIYENYNPLMNGVLNMNEQPLMTNVGVMPTVEPMHFKQLSEYEHLQPLTNWNVQNDRRVPILDPFNVLKRKPQPLRLPAKPAPKFAPLRAIPLTTLPPITVTHIYKYEEPNSGLRMPFEDDPLVENFPALSVALNEHLNTADVAHLKGYMTPPKLNQPVYYNMPLVQLPTIAPPFHNEFDILHKFNEAIKTQNVQRPQPAEYEDSEEAQQDEKNYSDDDVKKALQYIKHLKKGKSSKSSRGSKKFTSEKSERKRKKPKKPSSEESLEDEDDDKKRSKKPESFSEEEDNFKIKSLEELDEEESTKKVVKSKNKIADKAIKTDNTFSIKSFEELNPQESNKKPVKAKNKIADNAIKIDDNVSIKPYEELRQQQSNKKPAKSKNKITTVKAIKPESDQIRTQESQIVPTLDNEVSIFLPQRIR